MRTILALISIFCLQTANVNATFSDDFSNHSTAWSPVSGAWVAVNGQYQQREVGESFGIRAGHGDVQNENEQKLFHDDFSNPKNTKKQWTKKRGAFNLKDGQCFFDDKKHNLALMLPDKKGKFSQSDYLIRVKLGSKIDQNPFNSSIVYFRLTMTGKKNDNSYALVLSNDGALDLYARTNGLFDRRLASISVPKPEHGKLSTVAISAVGPEIKVWFDKPEDQDPDIRVYDQSYPSGSIGIGSQGGVSVFDEVTVLSITTIKARPSHLYVGGHSTLHFSSTANLSEAQVSAISPSGKVHGPISLTDCSLSSDCKLLFPDAFSMNANEAGTYTVVLDEESHRSVIPIEVRGKPLFSFAVISDTHIRDTDNNSLKDLQSFVADINQSRDFPLPSFVVITGDLTDNGTLSELESVKNVLDQLSVPYYPVLGNHDWGEDLRLGFPRGHFWSEVFGPNKLSYSWTFGDFLFLAEDGATMFKGKQNGSDFSNYLVWLKNELAAHPTKKAFLFCHYGHAAVRDDGDAYGYWWGGGNSNDVKDILEASRRVVAEFAGHSHISGLSKLDSIYYVHTTGFNNMGEYHYVEIYQDRMEVHAVRKDSYHWDLRNAYWQGSADSAHHANLYSFGLPVERQFKINYKAKNIDFLDAIALSERQDWDNYVFQADVQLGNEAMVGSNVAGLLFRYQDPDNYYAVLLDASKNKIRLQKKHQGVVVDLAERENLIEIGRKYQLRVAVNERKIQVYLNDRHKIKVKDDTFQSGRVGFKSYRANTAYDNVSIIPEK